MRTLNRREREEIIQFIIKNWDEMTYEQMGQEFPSKRKLTRQRIQQIVKKLQAEGKLPPRE